MVENRSRRLASRIAIVCATACACTLTGCVERRYTIRTNPPGALVVVNGEEIGRAPVSRNYTDYGDRGISLMLDGYQTQRVKQAIEAPWYDNLLTESISENVIPFTIRDERDFEYQMAPATLPSTSDVMSRGDSLRAQARAAPPARRGGILGFFGF